MNHMKIYPNSRLLQTYFVTKGNKIISRTFTPHRYCSNRSCQICYKNEAISVKCRLIKPWDSHGSNGCVNTLAVWRQGFHSDLRCQHADWDQLPAVAKEGPQFASKLFLFEVPIQECRKFHSKFISRIVSYFSINLEIQNDLMIYLTEVSIKIWEEINSGFEHRFLIWRRPVHRTSSQLWCQVYMEKASTLEPQTSLPRMPW